MRSERSVRDERLPREEWRVELVSLLGGRRTPVRETPVLARHEREAATGGARHAAARRMVTGEPTVPGRRRRSWERGR